LGLGEMRRGKKGKKGKKKSEGMSVFYNYTENKNMV
jgi:hypothetical protein